MRTLLTLLVVAAALAAPAFADQTYQFSWYSSDYLTYGSFGDIYEEFSSQMNFPTQPGHSIKLVKTTGLDDGYAQAFLACVWGLEEGDQVTASYWRWDQGVGYPRARLWAHYNDSLGAPDYRGHDLNLSDGLAYGNNSFGEESGWELFTHTWTMPADHTGMIVDAVIYGDFGQFIYVDELSVTVPDHAHLLMPGTYYGPDGSATPVTAETWGNVKALYQ